MESKDELKETDIKYRTRYQFFMINGIDINFSDILLDEKLNDISVYAIPHKTSTDPELLRIRSRL